MRNGREKVIPVKLYKNISTTVNQLGLNLQDLSKAEAKRKGLASGVKISNITYQNGNVLLTSSLFNANVRSKQRLRLNHK